MKKIWIIATLVLLLVLGAITAWKYCPRTVDRAELDPLYLRYEHEPGMATGFVKDYRVNDSVAVDVTTLQALDTAAWHRLMDDFGFPQEMIRFFESGRGTSTQAYTQAIVDITDTRKRPSEYSENCRLLIVKASEMTFVVYNNHSVSELSQITSTHIKKIKQ